MSVYSTPVAQPADELSSDDSVYFTPEVSFSCFTPCRRRIKSIETPIYAPDLSPTVPQSPTSTSASLRSVHLGSPVYENSAMFNNESRYFTPKRSSATITPKRTRSTPLKCISNIVTPVEVKRNIFKFDNRIAQSDKENRGLRSNNSCDLTTVSDSSLPLNSKSKLRHKSGSKSKSGVLQWLGMHRKSKTEFSSSKENLRKRKESSSPSVKEKECPLIFPVKNYGTICSPISEVIFYK